MRGKTDINQLHINCTNCTMTKESLPYLQAHCQSPTSHRYDQSFVKELAKPTQRRISKFIFPSLKKLKYPTLKPTKKTRKFNIDSSCRPRQTRTPACNTGLAKVAVQCFYDSFVGKQTLVHLINICGENRHLRQARKRYASFSSFNYFGFF